MICGCSAVTMKIDTAMHNQTFENDWFARLRTIVSSSRNENAIAWRLSQTENETADAVKQTQISWKSCPNIVAVD